MDLTPDEISVRGLTLTQAVIEEIDRAAQNGELDSGQMRCHVCYDPRVRSMVNRLIADGYTNSHIAMACRAINEEREAAGDDRQISPRCVWTHRQRHFNVDEPRQAAIRNILERRSAQDEKDFINGVGHAITPYAVLETAMLRGFQTMVDPANDVTVAQGLQAARQLYEMTQRDSQQRQAADVFQQMDRIISAAQEFIPPQHHAAFIARVRGEDDYVNPLSIAPPPGAVKEFTPVIKTDDRDEI